MCDQSAEQQRDGAQRTTRTGHEYPSMPSWPALRGKVVAFGRRQGVPCSSRSSKSEILAKSGCPGAAKQALIQQPMSSGKKILLGTVGLVVAAGVGWGVYSYLQRGIVRVQTGKVARQDLVSVVTASGEVRPRNYINIGANSMGRLTDIYVREGDMVEQGQELAKLETVQPAAEVAAQRASLELVRAELAARDAAIESNEASQKTQQASLKRSQAEFQRAKINYDRASELLEDKLIARQDYDQRRADYDAAQAAVEEAAARLEQLRAQREEVVAQRNSARRRVEQTEAQLRPSPQRAREALLGCADRGYRHQPSREGR